MQHLLLSIILLFPSFASAGESVPLTISQVVRNDRWAVAEGSNQDKPLIIRYRYELKDKLDLSAYPHLLKVLWSYDADASGMPETETNEAMAAFEDRLVEAVEPDQTAILVAIITNSGQREWLFYTSDVEGFGHRLTRMPQEKDRYPIDLSTEQDPHWSEFYERILGGIRE